MTAHIKEKNLIGYDPLAWMNDKDAQDDPIKVNEEGEKITSDLQNIEALSDELHDGEIKLDKVLNIQGASDFKLLLVKAFKHNERVSIDASEVVQVDTTHLQLFVISKKMADSKGKVLSFDFASDSFIETAELLGVFNFLELDSVMGGFF